MTANTPSSQHDTEISNDGPGEIEGGLEAGSLSKILSRYAVCVALVFGGSAVALDVLSEWVWPDTSPAITLVVLVVLWVASIACSYFVARAIGQTLDTLFNEQSEKLETIGPGTKTDLLSPSMSAYAPQLGAAANGVIQRYEDEITRLETLAFRDATTGLRNALSLDQHVRDCLTVSGPETQMGLLLIDIDRFKRFEDLVGAVRASQLIKQFSDRIASEVANLREELAIEVDRLELFRTGLDEFVVVAEGQFSRERMAGIAEAIRRCARQPFEIAGHWLRLTLSAGIVISPDDGESPEELMRNATLALDEARSHGRGNLRFFTPKLNRVAKGRLQLETELREAVRNDEFEAVYQPKVDFQTGRIVGAEALVRWVRPSGKMVSPAVFIPVAEEIGLIQQIGRKMLQTACTEARQWGKMHHKVAVAVNVSPKQLENERFSTEVIDVLCETGLHPEQLELEVTESLAVSNPRRVAEIMRPLRAMGVRLAIDDFGSGHANLTLLTQMAFDIFKIDRHFVAALEVDEQAPAVVEMILSMAETLQLETVAEGVETPAQIDFLRRRGCHVAQGYFYSPPVKASEFRRLLSFGKLPVTAAMEQKAS